MEQREAIEVSDAHRPQPIDQSIEEPPPPERSILQSEEGDGGAVVVGLGAPDSPPPAPPSVSPPASVEEAPVPDPAAGAGAGTGEQGGDGLSDVYSPPLIEQSTQEEPLPSAGEEAGGPQCEEGVGEAREMDDKKAHAFEPGVTAASAGTADEPLEGEGASIPRREEGPQEMDDAQLLGSPSDQATASAEEEDAEAPLLESTAASRSPAAAGDDAAGDADQMDVEETEAAVADSARRGRGRGRRKRGRPPKGQAARAPAKKRKEKEDEEVCFICFDGGDLVVCDRRGCPKVYHPSCVNRDEAFFRAKGRWNCGWHICSNCEKSAQYMCYTCTFSLCKGCISEAGFVPVRGNKGFCVTCMSTVMMIESSEDGNKKTGEIDFDDKSSWMYLFKDYWLDLKGKLSLTLEELTRAKTPRKESNAISRNESSDDLYVANDVHGVSSDSSSGHFEVSISSRKKAKKRPRNIANDVSSMKEAESEGASISEDVGWASKELLEFVAHMKDGDISALSQFDVQALLLEYIKRNNLRDPCRKSNIICDSRLQNLFGKTRVGHFEMLKLLESHFLTKEPSPVVTDDNHGGVVDPDPSQMDTEGNSDASTRMSSDRRRRTHKRLQEKEPQTNLDDYAAIDVHNINLMYLRRNLMEDLIDDIGTFSEKVVGTFVRIRIAGSGQRQDMYRLVQVVGIGKAAKKYRTGKKTTDLTLEISNLNKTEFITLDIISNQEFTEEECRRLRQSIKCGFIGRLTMGEVQEKAKVLRAARVNDWLESEKLRLGNLRDRASEKGRRKELRECVEKLQLLSTPEERMRRLNEVPEIHADPKMDPDYESSEDEGEPDDKKQDNSYRSRESFFLRNGSDGISPGKGVSISSNNWNIARKSANTTWESKRNTPTESAWDVGSSTSAGNRTNGSFSNQEKDVHQTSSSEAVNAQANANSLEGGASSNNQLVLKPGQTSVVPSETTSASPLTGAVAPSNISETEKIWHYQDPSGKVQGPFSMTQLRKWSTTGYFPTSLRTWRTSERQEDYILLTDALIGKFQKDSPQLEPQNNSIAQPMKVAAMMDGKGNNCDGGWRGDNNNTWTDNNKNEMNWKASRNDVSFSNTGNNESVRTDMWAAQSSAWSAPKSEVVNQKEGRVGNFSGGWQSSNDNNGWSGQPQGLNSSKPIAPFSGNPHRPPSYQGRGGRGRWNGGQDHQNSWNSNKPRRLHQPAYNSSNQLRNDSFNLPTPQPCIGGWIGVQGAFNNSSSTAPVQQMTSGWGTTPRGNEAEIPPTPITAQRTNSVGGWGSSSSPNVPTQTVIKDVGNSCPTASSSVPNTAKIAETADSVQFPEKRDCLGYSQMSDEQKNPSEPDAPIISEALQLPSRDETITQNSATSLSGSGSSECRNGSDKNQSLESACPSSNTRCENGVSDVGTSSQLNERQDLPVSRCNQLDPNMNRTEADDRSAAENTKISVDGGVLDPATSTVDAESNSKLVTAPSDAHQPPTVQHCGVADIKPMVASDALESVSAQESEASSTLKQEPDGSRANPACAGNVWEQIQPPKSEPSLSGPVPTGSGNLGILQEKRSSERPTPSLTSTKRRSKWDVCADPTSDNSQNSHLVSPVSTYQPTSFHRNATTTSEPAQPSNSGLGVVPQNPCTATGPAQANSSMIRGTAIQGNANAGWGAVTQCNMNVVWGIPMQGNPNLNIGWGTPVQANPSASTGWGTPSELDINVNMAWGTPAPGNPNQNASWVAPTQGNTALNQSWGAPAQGNPNPNPGCGAPAEGNTNQDAGWGALIHGNTNANAGSGAGQGIMNPSWNHNSSSAQQNQTGDGHSSGQSERGFHGRNLGHGGGRGRPWNRMQPDGGEGSLRPPLGGQTGVCRFHENGHCKKGAHCNYIHQ